MAGKTTHDDIGRTTAVASIPANSASARPPRLWICVLVSVVINTIALMLLGHFWSLTRPLPLLPAPRLLRIAVLPTPPRPPKPVVRPPRERPAPRRHVHVVQKATPERPRAARQATTEAPSARPHPVEASRPAPAGQGRQAGAKAIAPPALSPPAAATPASTPILLPARIARIPLLKPTLTAAPLSLTPLPVIAPPAPSAIPSGGSAGQGQGKGDTAGHGQGGSSGAGSGGGGGPFGIGSGGTGSGEGLRHIVYVLDISGSMTSRIDKARQELKGAMAGLVPEEKFDLITFSDRAHVFDSQLDPATPEMIARASYFLSTLQIGGGTNLDAALSTALALPGVNVVVVITDGDPTVDEAYQDIASNDQEKYFQILTQRIRLINVNRARIYTIGLVGHNPEGRDVRFESTRLLQQLSRDSGGTSKIVRLGVAEDF